MSEWKYLQVRFDPELYKRLAVVAAERGESMSDMVREWAKALYGEAIKVSPVERKVALQASKLVSLGVRGVADQKPAEANPGPLVDVDKPKVDPKTCKHSYNQNMVCWKCGYNPKP